jgi:Glycosyltransferase Family 4
MTTTMMSGNDPVAFPSATHSQMVPLSPASLRLISTMMLMLLSHSSMSITSSMKNTVWGVDAFVVKDGLASASARVHTPKTTSGNSQESIFVASSFQHQREILQQQQQQQHQRYYSQRHSKKGDNKSQLRMSSVSSLEGPSSSDSSRRRFRSSRTINSSTSSNSGTRTNMKNGRRDGISGGVTAGQVPALNRNPPRKVCLMIEPTPFTHVSGYANRFKEMLKFLKKAGDDVDILTVDSKTATVDLPEQFMGYPIRHTQGFTFPLYNHISLTFDLPEMKGARIIERLKPDIIHVTSPGFLLFAAIFYARVMKIPLVMSYHTHLPTYGK